MFSVVIPLYNKEKRIRECLNSVMNQTYRNFEIILINDGSTDSSLKIAKEIINNHPSTKVQVVDRENKGVSFTRNEGVQLASYDYVCFLDADDIWLPNFLEKMSSLISEYPEADLYCLAHKVSKNGGLPIIPAHGLSEGFKGYVNDFFQVSARGSVAKSSKVCVKKMAFSKVGGFPVGVVAGEDLFLWIQLALNGKVACDMSYCAIVNQEVDYSRSARKNSVPYPLVYYSKVSTTNKCLKKYLYRIFIRHFISSLTKFKFYESFLRLKYYLGVIK